MSKITRFRLTIEYDLDDNETTLGSELNAWTDGNVDINDVIATEGIVRGELIDENNHTVSKITLS